MRKIYIHSLLLTTLIFIGGFFSGCGNKDCTPKQIGNALQIILEDDMPFIYNINTITCSFPSENILRLETVEEVDQYIDTFKKIFNDIKPVNKQAEKIKKTYQTFIICFDEIKMTNKQIRNVETRSINPAVQKRLEILQKQKEQIFEKFNNSFTSKLYKVKGEYYRDLQIRIRHRLAEYCHVSLIDLTNKQILEVTKTAYPVWEKHKKEKESENDVNQACLNKAEAFYVTFMKELLTNF